MSTSPPTPAAELVQRGNYITAGQYLRYGEALTSQNSRFTATLGNDGRFCIFFNKPDGRIDSLYHCVIMTGREEGDYFAALQSDGNFSVHSGTGPNDNRGTIWSANGESRFEPDYFAIIRNDGNFCVFAGTGPGNYRQMIWCTMTNLAFPVRQQEQDVKPAPVPVNLGGTWSYGNSAGSWAFNAGTTFVQQFRVSATGRPNCLLVGMGSNQNPYTARVRFLRDTVVLFDHTFTARRQRSSDWATVFELDGFSEDVQAGEMLSFEITPQNNTSIGPLMIDSPDYPRGNLPRYGLMVARFSVDGFQEDTRPNIKVEVVAADESDRPHLLQNVQTEPRYPLGMRIVARAENDRDHIVTGAVWDFGLIAQLINECIQTHRAGSVTYYPAGIIPTLRSLPFYAARPGFYTFEVNIELVDRHDHYSTVEMGGLFEVTAPIRDSSEVIVDRINILKSRRTGKNYCMQLGNSRRGTVGITIRVLARLATTGVTGQLGIIQFVRGGRYYTKVDGSALDITTGGNWFLDRSTDDGHLTYMGTFAARRIRNDLSPSMVNLQDNPGVGLHDSCLRARVNETFRSYVVYRPDGVTDPKWASLGYFEWSWSGDISRANAGAPWPDVPTASNVTTAENVVWVQSYELPVWTNSTQYLKQRHIAEFGEDAAADFREREEVDVTISRQMEIRFNTENTEDLREQLEEVTGMRIATINGTGGSGFLMWAPPAIAAHASTVAGVTQVEELAVAKRYQRPDPRHPGESTSEKEYIILVAPYAIYDTAGDYRTYADSVSPQTVNQVASALSDIVKQVNPGLGVTANVRTYATAKLVFTAPPGDNVLLALAAHPQVRLIERQSHFNADDPPIHQPDLM